MSYVCENCMDSDCENCDVSITIPETNFEMVKKMNSIELASWVAVQIKKYYENSIIFQEEIEKITMTYIKWFDKDIEIDENLEEYCLYFMNVDTDNYIIPTEKIFDLLNIIPNKFLLEYYYD